MQDIEVKKAYNMMKKRDKINFGEYHKTVLHIHTPASHDYKLYKAWDSAHYQSIGEEEIFRIAKDEGVLYGEYSKLNDLKELASTDGYEDVKEMISYYILAYNIYINLISIVVVTDHNTIDGIVKLENAIKRMRSKFPNSIYPEVIAGIEISCADKIHLVAITDYENLKKYFYEKLMGILLSQKEGTYKTSLDLITELNELDIFNYIAHINSSDIYNNSKFLSGGYKQQLLSNEKLNYIGVSSLESIKRVSSFLNKYIRNEKYFLLDNDAHCIEDLQLKHIWIKASKRNPDIIVDSIKDYNLSVSLEKPTHVGKKYIRAMCVVSNNDIDKTNFLTNKDKTSDFQVNFSPSLNCFIGGRGTGKSTLLDLLNLVMSQRCESVDKLEFLSRNSNVYVLYELNKKEYIIQLILPILNREKAESILRYYGQNYENRYNYRYEFNEKAIQDYISKKDLKVYEVVNRDKIKKVENKTKILEAMFDRKYSMNDLVNIASTDRINNFILEFINKNKKIRRNYNKKTLIDIIASPDNMEEFLNKVEKHKENRKSSVIEILNEFNEKNSKNLKIEYSQSEVISIPLIEWFFAEGNLQRSFYTFKITKIEVIDLLNEIIDEVGINNFIKMFIDREINLDIKSVNSISKNSQVNNENLELDEIDETNIGDFKKELISLFKDVDIEKIKQYFHNYLYNYENFELKFNINANTIESNNKVQFKNVKNLSLGQKVVAMFNFILAYSEYADDFRPLIIDQPEDNLDSQYIYHNLVDKLIDIKNKRQIIIATHNATIVTNAMAELVCVMKSDGDTAWVEKQGYPSEKKIKKAIVNHLEGGIDSFKHKISVYNEVLK
ncbi:TPA: AAA family ATPase [Staphylococcus pseudintermedius]|uniref:Spaf_1101 family AAA-like ATPase n=1 Tax=Staphylococcus pseudintermedius TaxID=283734 RepID=UPI0016557128|nr:AAA family ATPase [Staphylococcus pseudintermedius]MBC8685217.1 AAA family ATPase [Staphylococcus pseudintermedius]MDF0253834.1 AAA family ATPase [Staphylococcus pseudintermedius]MDF0307692.1 AAA family ATPase [Staphylococcus pseudintermedius]HAR6050138.1 AAA family ATPase [Staphylococcus pseudintermedius]